MPNTTYEKRKRKKFSGFISIFLILLSIWAVSVFATHTEKHTKRHGKPLYTIDEAQEAEKIRQERKTKEDQICQNPGAYEFEHIAWDCYVIEGPYTKGNTRFITVETDFGNFARVVLPDPNDRYHLQPQTEIPYISYGYYIRIYGEISGVVTYHGKKIPLIDDTRISVNLDYEPDSIHRPEKSTKKKEG